MMAGTALVTFTGDALGRRRLLLAFTLLAGAGLVALALVDGLAPLAAVAFAGSVNGIGRDRSPAQVLDQAALADHSQPAARTRVFVRYTLLGDIGGAVGALAAGLPAAIMWLSGLAQLAAYRWVFGGAGALTIASCLAYALLPKDARRGAAPSARASWRRLKGRTTTLASLFAIDSLGGGFLAGSILAYWFFRRHGLDAGQLGLLFFAARILNAASYLAAERLARSIGLVRTMVFTHLPSSVVLVMLPFVPLPAAIGLFLLREALVQMDVPTRQSYVAAVIPPADRTAALGLAGLARNTGWTIGPALAGTAMAALGMAAPLFIGAALKIVYDVALFASFRGVRPAEELR
jgi:predicted MFS family arabinose efflux permease